MINDVIKISLEAAEAIMKIYRSEKIEVDIKNDNSPITQADMISNKIICEGLNKISSYPIMSEENIIPFSIRKNWDTFWLIDPLDGTKDFIAKNGEFTINIALVKKGNPILGVVCIPKTKDMYWAQINEGAFKNGNKIFNNSKRKDLVAADSNFHSTKEMKSFFKRYKIKTIRKLGSSIKICKLAEGEIDVYPRLNETKEWDTAATQIIAEEAGCKLIDIYSGLELKYNKEDYRNPFFIASRKDLEFYL